MVVAVVLIAVNANAQFGIKAGYVSTAFKEKGGGESYRHRPMDGVKVGLDYDIMFGRSGVSFRPGVNYIYFGDSEKMDGITDQQRYHFLNVPLDFKYALDLGRECSIYAFVGPKLVLGMAGKDTYKGDGFKYVTDTFSGEFTAEEDGASEKGHEHALLNRFDVQVGAGLGFQFYGVSLEFGYDWGMLNLSKHVRDDYSIKRDQISATLGYTF
uniref:Outer membrane protein beta-barrel domain-containing protein n=1 Tax=uncultured bacterium contig00023(2014) TaxID=1465628 RepID=A0A060D1D9_9BACT|nr:hypothetical protein [uncultured bacterium contig00023(2014)]